MTTRAELQDRIRTKSRIAPNGCWNWTGSLSAEGYGQTSISGRSLGVHRASYLAFVGPIAEGMTIDHTCFNPACVNPNHLRTLTREENARTKDPNKTPPWVVAARTPRYRKPKRQPLPADAPVFDFEEAS